MGINDNNETFEDAHIVFRNFGGREGLYNSEGDRSFSIRLTDEQADHLEKKGWNVKRKPPREEGDDNFNHLPVKVGFKGPRPPRIVMVTSRGRTNLDETLCEILDFADIKTVDLIVRPYQWAVNGKTGIKAYLHAIYVTINEDELELKYQDVPEIGYKEPLALEVGAGEYLEVVEDEN